MAEIERLTSLLNLCKNSGCSRSDFDRLITAGNFNFVDKDGNTQAVPTNPVVNELGKELGKKAFVNGPIKFPDCGLNPTSECFWRTGHYTQSGWLTFLTVVVWPSFAPVLGCAIFSEYDYGFCLGNFAAVVVDHTTKKVGKYNPSFISTLSKV